MAWKAQIISASEIDDQLKQSVSAIIVDDDGERVDSLNKDFYGDPDIIRQEVETWKLQEFDKMNVSARKINEGDLI